MSISDVIDTRYRLRPEDLGGRARTVLICRVGVEGVEEMRPLLHLEGVARPLALDAEQRVQMAQIARSSLPTDWVGMALVLRPARLGGEETIRLHGLEERIAAAPSGVGNWAVRPARSWRLPLRPLARLLLVAALIVAAFVIATWIEQMPSLTLW